MPYKERMDRRREEYRKEVKKKLEEMRKEREEILKEEEIDILKELYEEAQTLRDAQMIKKEILERIDESEFKKCFNFDEDRNPLIKALKEKRRKTQYRKEKEKREKQEEEKRRIEEAKTKEEKEHDRRIQEIHDTYTPQIREIDDKYPSGMPSCMFTKHYSNVTLANRLKRPIHERWGYELEKERKRWEKEKLQLGL